MSSAPYRSKTIVRNKPAWKRLPSLVSSSTLVKRGNANEYLPATNSNGGILINEAEIVHAMHFFDRRKNGKLTPANVRERLAAFSDDITVKDVRQMFGGKNEFSVNDLKTLLLQNEVENFDPFEGKKFPFWTLAYYDLKKHGIGKNSRELSH
mmetsp:Transcript_45220/g.54431  ORF Transcript_45220/g.54431 Transcript_45220/m.54431 type:complete len:152 (+) Transcript_45220:75-530(+)